MHLVYIDDSGDDRLSVFSALAIPVEGWRTSLNLIKEFRQGLKRSDGIHHLVEFHAWKLVSGRGQLSDHIISKTRRCEIFRNVLRLTASLPGARLFNVCRPADTPGWAFERLLNRINRTMLAWNSYATLICDEGKEGYYTLLCRRMGVYNPIPSRYGQWPEGEPYRNIPTERIVEDPFFKNSKYSYFVQLADCAAYALLRRENPLPSKTAYGLHTAFNLLKPICVREANPRDDDGIIR